MAQLTGRTAVITGAAHGIGRAIALTLAQRGCDIGMLELDMEAAQLVAADIKVLGRKVTIQSCDVTKPDQVASASAALLKAMGPCDILVNNAGICRMGDLLTMDETDWRALFAVNVDGVSMSRVLLCRRWWSVARERWSISPHGWGNRGIRVMALIAPPNLPSSL